MRCLWVRRPQCEAGIKGNLALRAVGAAQGLSVPQNEVDDEVMMLQAQSLQRGEKFKESEVRPKVEAQLEKTMILSWLEAQGKVRRVQRRTSALRLLDPTRPRRLGC